MPLLNLIASLTRGRPNEQDLRDAQEFVRDLKIGERMWAADVARVGLRRLGLRQCQERGARAYVLATFLCYSVAAACRRVKRVQFFTDYPEHEFKVRSAAFSVKRLFLVGPPLRTIL